MVGISKSGNYKCAVCKSDKDISSFSKSQYHRNEMRCKDCLRAYAKKYSAEHKDDRAQYNKDHKEEIDVYNKQYHNKHSDEISVRKKLTYDPIKSSIANAKYHKEHKDEINDRHNKNYPTNKPKKLASQRAWLRERRKTDPSFKLREAMSNAILQILKKNGGSKLGYSIEEYLGKDWTDLLKTHIETLWAYPSNLDNNGKVWMSWKNHGHYSRYKAAWIDDDYSTHCWNIDHIIPSSMLPASTMDEPNFQQCWALDNLRPLCAKQNDLDKNNRTPEQIATIKTSISIFLKNRIPK